MRKKIEKIYMGLIIAFMYLPIATMIILSFNASKSRARWGGFTLKWYLNLASDSAIINALANTLIIALISTIVATLIGTITCVALMGLGKKSRTFLMGIANIPMINADIVTGISLMLLFRALHFGAGFLTVLIAHITFNIPYVMLSVMPRMKTINPYTYEAALDLGAEPLFAFRKTILPDLMPAILSGAMKEGFNRKSMRFPPSFSWSSSCFYLLPGVCAPKTRLPHPKKKSPMLPRKDPEKDRRL